MEAQMLVGMTQFFTQFVGNQSAVDARARPRPEAVYERFRRMNPKDFLGTTEPMIAEGWIKSIEGDSSVEDFVNKFKRGCHFVPLIANDAQSKLRHFMDGLQPVLRRDVRVAGPTTYTVAVSRALAAEQDQRDIEADRQRKRPYQAPAQQQHQQPQFKRPFQGPPGKKPYQGPPKGNGPIKQKGAPQRPVVFPTVPSGEELSATSVVKDIDLELHGHLVYAYLSVLPMPEFDIILGMDWLTRNRVLIDFLKRSVLARRLIFKGCQAFLASIISTPDVPTPSLSEVPVVRHFPDVFTNDVTGLPPEREVEFAIDLMPATVPVSKAPYRLAPAEMLELKQQI
ncbi:uncharacterized protein [Primulina eburnea]|uniref:uncharacterized protein n=1 Tax=Primulina eburnea TaxID=1245227 RepID=UPI003C6BEDBE